MSKTLSGDGMDSYNSFGTSATSERQLHRLHLSFQPGEICQSRRRKLLTDSQSQSVGEFPSISTVQGIHAGRQLSSP